MKKAGENILIASADKLLVSAVAEELRHLPVSLHEAMDGFEAIKTARKKFPRLIVFDSELSKMNGIEAGRVVRQDPDLKDTILIFLVGSRAEYAAINKLKLLPDDCFMKPVDIPFLIHRIAELIPAKTGDSFATRQGDLAINRETYLVYYKGKEYSFPRKEFELLYLLASHPGKVFSRDEIMQRIWNKKAGNKSERTIDVHIRKLRGKLNGINIVTVKGVGYKLPYR